MATELNQTVSTAGSGWPKSHLRMIIIAIGSGLIAAFHIGKIPAALPYLDEYFGLSLTQSGLVVSSFSLLAALFGLSLGLFAGRLGPWNAGVLGLICVGAGSLAGTMMQGWYGLLGSRILEGFGFVLVAVTMPGLINRICPNQYRAIALGIWGAFIPAAMSLMLVVSPAILATHSWQGLWWVVGILSIAWALIFALGCAKVRRITSSRYNQATLKTLASAIPIWSVASFVCYSALFAAVTAFLPSFWIISQHLSPGDASYLASIIVIGNIAGNILAGYLVGKGYRLARIISVAFVAGGGCAALIFVAGLPLAGQVAAAFGFTLFSGMLPGAVFASIAEIAPSPDTIPVMTGLIFQGAGIGQVLGPIGISFAVSQGGSWSYGSLFVATIAVIGLLFGRALESAQNRPVDSRI